ncbi:hypothetical protein Tco_0458119, partial [Tanacetum coccineum]
TNVTADNKGCITLADLGSSKKVVELATMTGARSMKGTMYQIDPEVIIRRVDIGVALKYIPNRIAVGATAGPADALGQMVKTQMQVTLVVNPAMDTLNECV